MIYLSNGHFYKLNCLLAESKFNNSIKGETIQLNIENEPTIVQCRRIEYFESAIHGRVMICYLWDGGYIKPAILDFNSNKSKYEFKLGSFIMIEEVSFQAFADLKLTLPDDLQIEDIMTSLTVFIKKYKLIGHDEIELQEEAEVLSTEKEKQHEKEEVKHQDEPTCSIAQLDEIKMKTRLALRLMIEKKSQMRPFASDLNSKRIRMKVSDGSNSLEMVAFHAECEVLNSLHLKEWYLFKSVDILKANPYFREWPNEVSSIWDLRYQKGSSFVLLHKPKLQQSPMPTGNASNDDMEIASPSNVNSLALKLDVTSSMQTQLHSYFTPIYDLISFDRGTTVNVIGVITQVNEVFIKKFKKEQGRREITIRNVTIADSSNSSVQVAFWGREAEGFDYEKGTIMALKGAQITDYAGITLSVTMLTYFSDQSQSSSPEVLKLKEWQKQNLKPISTVNYLKLKKRNSQTNQDNNPNPSKKPKL